MENNEFVNKDPVIGDNGDFAKVMKSVSAPLEESQRAYDTWTPKYEEVRKAFGSALYVYERHK